MQFIFYQVVQNYLNSMSEKDWKTFLVYDGFIFRQFTSLHNEPDNLLS